MEHEEKIRNGVQEMYGGPSKGLLYGFGPFLAGGKGRRLGARVRRGTGVNMTEAGQTCLVPRVSRNEVRAYLNDLVVGLDVLSKGSHD